MQGSLSMQVTLTEGKQLAMHHPSEFNIGYLFPKMLLYQMGLKDLCQSIEQNHKISYNLYDVLQMLITARLIAPASKLSSYEYAFKFLQQPSFDLQHVYRSLDVLCKHTKAARHWLTETKKSFSTTAPTISLKSKKPEAMHSMARVKKTAPIQSYRWGCFWMATDSLCASACLPETKMNSRPSNRWKRKS